MKHFVATGRYFPGIRARAPLTFMTGRLRDLIFDCFGLAGRSLHLPMCHYSLVTTPPEALRMEQRIPHIDSTDPKGLASIHYLFHRSHGGTAFYRHRRTGFEYVDDGRKETYLQCLREETSGPVAPPAAYIDGDTPLFRRVASENGVSIACSCTGETRCTRARSDGTSSRTPIR